MSDKDLIWRGDVEKFLCDAYDDDMIDEGEFAYLTSEANKLPAVPREMTAREFAKAFRRMCDSYDVNGRNNCEGCELWRENICCLCDLPDIIPIVEAWAREHPERSEE